MTKNLLILISVCAFVSGCTTARSPSKTAELQIQVNQLQQQVQEKDQEIEELKLTVNNLNTQLEGEENFAFGDVEDLDVSRKRKKSSASAGSNDVEIIRVAVAPADVQKALKNAGYYNGNIDGRIGSGSKQAIRDFQKDHQLTIDGIIGKKTWEELKNYLN